MRKLCLVVLYVMLSQSVCFSNEIKVVGWVEKATLQPENLMFKAKMDTGAFYSSLNASHIEQFMKDGKQWVRFSTKDQHNREMTLERPVIKTSKVKLRDGGFQERPIVPIDICLGGIIKEAKVNLVDRSRFRFSLLLGRSFIKNDFAIDPDENYTTEPDCKGSGNSNDAGNPKTK